MVPSDETDFSKQESKIELDFEEWLALGWKNKWVGPVVCETHDGVPCSEEESNLLWDGHDICLSIIRVYDCAQHADDVERDHSPSQWRKNDQQSLS